MKLIQKWLDQICTAFSALLLAAMMLIVIYNVFARFFGGGIRWYMEGAQYINVFAVMCAAAGVTVNNAHLRISGLESAFPWKYWKPSLQLIQDIVMIVFYVMFALGSIHLAQNTHRFVSTMPTVSMATVYWMLPITSVLNVIAAIVHLVNLVIDTVKEGRRAQ